MLKPHNLQPSQADPCTRYCALATPGQPRSSFRLPPAPSPQSKQVVFSFPNKHCRTITCIDIDTRPTAKCMHKYLNNKAMHYQKNNYNLFVSTLPMAKHATPCLKITRFAYLHISSTLPDLLLQVQNFLMRKGMRSSKLFKIFPTLTKRLRSKKCLGCSKQKNTPILSTTTPKIYHHHQQQHKQTNKNYIKHCNKDPLRYQHGIKRHGQLKNHATLTILVFTRDASSLISPLCRAATRLKKRENKKVLQVGKSISPANCTKHSQEQRECLETLVHSALSWM